VRTGDEIAGAAVAAGDGLAVAESSGDEVGELLGSKEAAAGRGNEGLDGAVRSGRYETGSDGGAADAAVGGIDRVVGTRG